jgi:CheY-like chemotaxis protein
VSGPHFISYSSVDGQDAARQLAEALTAATPPASVWLDKDRLMPGRDWDDQIVEALRTCDSLLFVMTGESVTSQSVCKKEWSRALSYKKPIIPLLMERGIEIPFRLQDRQYIDFAECFEKAAARLCAHLAWLASPEGVLQSLKDRLADANYDLRRATDAAQRRRIQDDLDWLERQVADQQRLIDDPRTTAARTDSSIAGALCREPLLDPPTPPGPHTTVINSPPAIAPGYFQGRDAEIQLLFKFLGDDSRRLLIVSGRGGTGKTALVCRALERAAAGLSPRGDRLAIDGIVYLGGNGSRPLTAANLYADLAALLPAETANRLDALSKNPQAGLRYKMQVLLASLSSRHVLLVLDNLETLVDPETRRLEGELSEVLHAVLTLPQHGVKVILTTRQAEQDLQLNQPARQLRIDLDEGLPSPHAENLLRAMDMDGKVGLRTAPDALLDEARRRTRGFPRALEALFAILSADRNTSLEEVLADGGRTLPDNVVEALVGEAFSRLDLPSQRVMQALAVYGRPVTAVAVDYLLQPYAVGVNSAPLLDRLANMRLAAREARAYSLHPADLAYALSRVPWGDTADRAAGDSPPYTRFALLRRGADYFRLVRQASQVGAVRGAGTPYLAEFDLCYAARDYERAGLVLEEMNRGILSAAREPGVTVLVVDDSPVDRHVAGVCLLRERPDMKVLYAENGREALKMLQERAPDLVLTDLHMPEMDGLELVVEVRRAFPLVPVILMTAFGSEEIAIQALQKGAASYVPKRSLAEHLAETVESVLSVFNAQRDQRRLLECLTQTEGQFMLDNDPTLIPPLLGYLQENLTRMGLCDHIGLVRVGSALREALLNAICRGNLEVPPGLREKDEGAYYALLRERQREKPYRTRRVHVTARESPAEAVYVIRDEGPGFDPSQLPDPTDPSNLDRVSGRGLMLIRTFMDNVSHNKVGNQITMVKRRDR